MLVLSELCSNNCTGYQLIKRLQELTEKKPSPGSVYSLLENMCGEGLIEFEQQGKKKLYSITSKGKNAVNTLLKQKQELINKHLELLESCATIGDQKEQKSIMKLAELLRNDNGAFTENFDVWIELRQTVTEIVINRPKKKKQMRSIIKNTIQDLKKLKRG